MRNDVVCSCGGSSDCYPVMSRQLICVELLERCCMADTRVHVHRPDVVGARESKVGVPERAGELRLHRTPRCGTTMELKTSTRVRRRNAQRPASAGAAASERR